MVAIVLTPPVETRRSRKSLGNVAPLDDAIISVEDPHKKPFMGGGHSGSVEFKTVYRIVVKDAHGRLWSADKRYSDFEHLYKIAEEKGVFDEHPQYTFPSKKWLQHSEEVKEERRKKFNELLTLLNVGEAKLFLLGFLIDCEESDLESPETGEEEKEEKEVMEETEGVGDSIVRTVHSISDCESQNAEVRQEDQTGASKEGVEDSEAGLAEVSKEFDFDVHEEGRSKEAQMAIVHSFDAEHVPDRVEVIHMPILLSCVALAVCFALFACVCSTHNTLEGIRMSIDDKHEQLVTQINDLAYDTGNVSLSLAPCVQLPPSERSTQGVSEFVGIEGVGSGAVFSGTSYYEMPGAPFSEVEPLDDEMPGVPIPDVEPPKDTDSEQLPSVFIDLVEVLSRWWVLSQTQVLSELQEYLDWWYVGGEKIVATGIKVGMRVLAGGILTQLVAKLSPMWRHICFMFASALVIAVDVEAFSLPQWAWLAKSSNFLLESMYIGIGIYVVFWFFLENERQEGNSIARSTRDESYQCS